MLELLCYVVAVIIGLSLLVGLTIVAICASATCRVARASSPDLTPVGLAKPYDHTPVSELDQWLYGVGVMVVIRTEGKDTIRCKFVIGEGYGGYTREAFYREFKDRWNRVRVANGLAPMRDDAWTYTEPDDIDAADWWKNNQDAHNKDSDYGTS